MTASKYLDLDNLMRPFDIANSNWFIWMYSLKGALDKRLKASVTADSGFQS